MRTVVPTAGNVTLLLGWAWAVRLDDELGDVALACAVDLGDDVADEAGPELSDEDEAVP
jgi:hypothetical protein